MLPVLKWALLPLSPIAITVGFIAGLVRAGDKRIACYCDGKPVTVGEIRRWGASKGDKRWSSEDR